MYWLSFVQVMWSFSLTSVIWKSFWHVDLPKLKYSIVAVECRTVHSHIRSSLWSHVHCKEHLVRVSIIRSSIFPNPPSPHAKGRLHQATGCCSSSCRPWKARMPGLHFRPCPSVHAVPIAGNAPQVPSTNCCTEYACCVADTTWLPAPEHSAMVSSPSLAGIILRNNWNFHKRCCGVHNSFYSLPVTFFERRVMVISGDSSWPMKMPFLFLNDATRLYLDNPDNSITFLFSR